MAWAPNVVPPIAIKPTSFAIVLPSTAKTVFIDTSNTAILVPSVTDKIFTLGSIFVQPVAAYVAARLMLFKVTAGGVVIPIDEITITAPTAPSTTVGLATLPFTKWTAASPLILAESESLLIGSTVAQTANVLFAHAQLAKMF